jgi:hypothetical protein
MRAAQIDRRCLPKPGKEISVMSADSPQNNPENGSYANLTAPIACKMAVPSAPGSLGKNA